MKTDGTSEVLPLSKLQKIACSIVMGVMLLVAGLIMILAGAGVIDAPVSLIAAPTVLFGLGVSMLAGAIISRNSVSMWVAGVLLTCGTVSLLAAVTEATYAHLYPLYIASPGIGCLFAMVFSEYKFEQFKAVLFFLDLGAVFALQSSGACGWGLTGGVLAAFIGICIILFTLGSIFGKGNKDA